MTFYMHLEKFPGTGRAFEINVPGETGHSLQGQTTHASMETHATKGRKTK